ncbi:serine hydrolase domain-containing protein [Sphingomonas sp.]|uniref:serine hydrolase domain-containing protein n=1 Tax=Sphingomonas sp. TaxID=28214 RepID=UPI0035BBD37E
MKPVFGYVTTAAVAVLAATIASGQAQQRATPPQARAAGPAPVARLPMRRNAVLPTTQALFDGYVRSGKMPGIVGAFGVGDLPTQFVTAGAQGLEPGQRPADADTLWRVYSMTKPITGMAAMMLVEDGKLSLDEPLGDIFPAFRSMKVLTDPDTSLASRPAARPITIRNLLTHTAGLGYNIITKGPLLKEYERLGILPGAVNAAVEVQAHQVRPKSLAEFANRVATLPLIADPGTKWSYSIGLDVMGAVVEKVSGMSFERFVQTRIFTPLGMTRSYWQVPRDRQGLLSTNYTFVGDKVVPLDPAATSTFLDAPSFAYGGAGLVMSARDYDRFLHMLQDEGELDGVRVMKPETVRLAMSNLLPAGVFFTGIGGGTGGTQAPVPMGFGAGGSVYLADKPNGPGKGTYGWGGAAGTIAWVDPVKRARGTVMVNYFPAERWPTRAQIPAALAQDVARLAPR